MNTLKFSLEGKVAVVTGGSRGIGRAIALAFADAGAEVVVSSRSPSDLEKVADEIRTRGRRGLAVTSDVTNVEDLKKLVEKVKVAFSRIDILVNNAGGSASPGPLMDATEWAWDATININLRVPFLLSQLVARMMREQGGGNIINVSSIGGIKPDLNIYSVAKAGLMMLTQVMAKEWGRHKIRVNAIAPGFIKTRLTEPLWKVPAVAEVMAKNRALVGHLGAPEEVAGAALFLASAASSYITGATIVVDGGELLGSPSFPP